MLVNIFDYIPTSEHAAIQGHTSKYDCRPALLKAIEDNLLQARNVSTSSEITFGPGTFYFTRAVDIKSTIILSSTAGVAANSVTILQFPEDSDGLRFHRADTIARELDEPATTGADNSIIRGLRVEGGGPQADEGSGIVARCRIKIEHCSIRSFGQHGIEIFAQAITDNISKKGNANGWTITDVNVAGCGQHGLYIEGADTNTGYSLRYSGISNGGYGLYDKSFLGNTHIGAHVANNQAGAYFAGGQSTRSIFLGCYAEEPQRSFVEQPSIIIGGKFGPNDGDGQIISGGELTPFSVPSKDVNTKRKVETRIGMSGIPFEMRIEGQNAGWQIAWDKRFFGWEFKFGGSHKFVAFSLTTSETSQSKMKYTDRTPVGPGEIVLEKYLFRNSQKLYEVFEAKSIMQRIKDLEAQVESLSTTKIT